MSLRHTRTTTPNVAEALGKAVSHPGIDPRTHMSLAVVKAVGVDPNGDGILVDVVLMPSQVEETVHLGASYAGPGFGFYLPLEVDDTVLVAFPNGDMDAGGVVVQRLWAAAEPPPISDITSSGKPILDLVLVVKKDQHLRIITDGSGNVTMIPKGTGKVGIGGEPGAAGMEPMVLGTTLQTYLASLTTWLTALATWAGTQTPPFVGGPPPTPGTVTATKGEVK